MPVLRTPKSPTTSARTKAKKPSPAATTPKRTPTPWRPLCTPAEEKIVAQFLTLREKQAAAYARSHAKFKAVRNRANGRLQRDRRAEARLQAYMQSKPAPKKRGKK